MYLHGIVRGPEYLVYQIMVSFYGYETNKMRKLDFAYPFYGWKMVHEL